QSAARRDDGQPLFFLSAKQDNAAERNGCQRHRSKDGGGVAGFRVVLVRLLGGWGFGFFRNLGFHLDLFRLVLYRSIRQRLPVVVIVGARSWVWIRIGVRS